MQLNQNPLFRKTIAPWYDSVASCYTVIICMLFVFCFGIAGIFEAAEKTEYNEYVWVPILLVIMSLLVTISIIIRLIKRYAHKSSKQNYNLL